jgi:hypothetical protein
VKITKLQHGYVIRLSDVEMSVLDSFVCEGEAGPVHDIAGAGWSPGEKAAYTRRLNKHGSFMGTDENRRR